MSNHLREPFHFPLQWEAISIFGIVPAQERGDIIAIDAARKFKRFNVPLADHNGPDFAATVRAINPDFQNGINAMTDVKKAR